MLGRDAGPVVAHRDPRLVPRRRRRKARCRRACRRRRISARSRSDSRTRAAVRRGRRAPRSWSADAVTLISTSRSRASVCSPSTTWRTMPRSSTGLLGRRCALSSMRDSDSRSSISRAMRVACACMIDRNRVRAAGSSRAGPCRVSMKPDSAASGVRSSWLALATKSARISSTRRSGVRSSSVTSTSRVGRLRRRTAHRDRHHDRFMPAFDRHALDELDPLRRRRSRSRAGSRPGLPAPAAPSETGSPRRIAGATARAGAFRRQHFALDVERDDRLRQPGQHRRRGTAICSSAVRRSTIASISGRGRSTSARSAGSPPRSRRRRRPPAPRPARRTAHNAPMTSATAPSAKRTAPIRLRSGCLAAIRCRRAPCRFCDRPTIGHRQQSIPVLHCHMRRGAMTLRAWRRIERQPRARGKHSPRARSRAIPRIRSESANGMM